jgi:outer membrane lipoprotein-sorting protein
MFSFFGMLPAQTKSKKSSNPPVAPKEVSDPEAKATLEKMRKKYQAFQTMEADFALTLEIPQQAKEIQKGKIWQKGLKYKLDFNDQTVLSDGKAVWMIMSKNKEVQINNMPDPGEDEGILSPQALFRIYERKDFIYGITNEYAANGKILQEIEFKPTDKFSEYSKLRLTVDKKTAEFVELKGFSKDGSRYTLVMSKLVPNKPIEDAVFVFNKASFPGFHVEDLRD